AAFLQINVRQHHAIASNQFARQDVRQGLFFNLFPAIMRYSSWLHQVSPAIRVVRRPIKLLYAGGQSKSELFAAARVAQLETEERSAYVICFRQSPSLVTKPTSKPSKLSDKIAEIFPFGLVKE